MWDTFVAAQGKDRYSLVLKTQDMFQMQNKYLLFAQKTQNQDLDQMKERRALNFDNLSICPFLPKISC